jgi:tyrocidine synthetase-3
MENNKKDMLDKLNQLSPAQRQALLSKVKRHKENHQDELDAQRLFSQASTITEVFEQIAETYPEKTALVLGDEQVSYDELNRRANQLAHFIKQQALQPESLIGLMCDRSIELIVAILAILKAGAAYVPLDPNNPKSRLSYIARDSQLKLILTQESVSGILAADNEEYELVSLNRPQVIEQLASLPEQNISVPPSDSRNTGTSLAYIIYTSGSTGQPKGVMVEHNNVLRLFNACNAHYQFSEQDVWVLFHSYAFDFSVWEIFGALLYGATLVIATQEACRSPEQIQALLIQNKVTVLNQTPTAFYNLMPYFIKNITVNSLRYIIFGGEALELGKLTPMFDCFADNPALNAPEIINMYGITETTVHASYYRVTPDDCSKRSSPIGKLLNDLKGFVFNESLQAVPDQVAGELYISGAGVTRGYLHRNELTAERFVQHPTQPGLRLYRTGDLVKRMPGSDYHYVGRADQQVKIRGFRIELGEIESALTQLRGISAAVVNPYENADGDKNLAAYLVPFDKAIEKQYEIDEIVQHLNKILPRYMIPVTFQYLEALPLNQNGKIERSALPKPEQVQVAQKAYEAPSSQAEKVIVDAWQSVLDIEQVGIHDHFFDLGGDSIKSLAIVSKVRESGLGINVADLFTYPVLESLAACIQKQVPQASSKIMEPFSLCPDSDKTKLPSGIINAYPISKLQEGMIFHYGSQVSSGNAETKGLYHNVSRISLDTSIDIAAFKTALARLVSRHDILHTSFHMQGFSIPLQLVHQQIELPLGYTDLSMFDAKEQQELLDLAYTQALTKRLNVELAPLFSVHVHKLSSQKSEMTWVEHHALLDGWSVEILFKELSELYQAELEQREAQLADTPQYVNFIAAEQEAIANDTNTQFWRNYLQDAEFASLPAPDQASKNKRTSITHSFDEALTSALERLAKQLKVSLKSVALAAHMHVLKTFTGEEDLITGLSLHGRPELENSSQSLGLFVSVLPFRLKVAQESWQQLIVAVSQGEQRIWQQRHFPLSCILEATNQTSLFNYSFNFLDFTTVAHDSSQHLNKVQGVKAHTANEFKLSVNFNRAEDKRLQIGMTWDQNAFSDGQIEQLLQYYETTLRVMTLAPKTALYALSQEDETKLLAFNSKPSLNLGSHSVCEVFKQHAAEAPDKLVVRFAKIQLTYKQLEDKSNQLANYLTQQGVLPGNRVALVTSRSLDMIISILGIIKTGACYVPIDVRYPIPRIKQMLQTSDANYILYEAGFADDLAIDSANSSELSNAIAKAGLLSGEYASKDSTSSLLNIIFTSGSTGVPKGVEITQKGLLRLLKNQSVRQLPKNDMVMLHLSALAFDAATEEIWLPLLSGGELVIYPEQHIDLNKLSQVIKANNINTAFLTAALFERWIEQLPYGKTGLSYLTVGGDVLNPVSASRLYQKDPTIKLFNGYGPTENTVFSTFFHVPEAVDSRYAISLGTPLNNTYAYVLDKEQRLLPLGAPGELYLAGDGLANGYYENQAQTDDKFIELQLRPEEEKRKLYKTGDQVFWSQSGTLNMLGRIDNQIKLRGFRIEPGELERVLESHPDVNHAAAILQCDEHGKKLIAFVSGDLPTEIGETNGIMKKFLKARLPHYLVPSLVIGIENIPLTVNGKVDRNALKEYSIALALSAIPATALVTPSTETEEKLLSIWINEIKSQSIGVECNFFDLGGDSLSATRLVSVINQKLNISLALNQVFEHQTIKELAQYIDVNFRNTSEAMESLVF